MRRFNVYKWDAKRQRAKRVHRAYTPTEESAVASAYSHHPTLVGIPLFALDERFDEYAQQQKAGAQQSVRYYPPPSSLYPSSTHHPT